jgi:hypothetical protein
LVYGGRGILRSNDPAEYEKAVHYNELVANAVMLQTVADQTQVIRQLIEEGYPVRAEDLERLSPYVTQHLKRLGQYPNDFAPPESRPPTSPPISVIHRCDREAFVNIAINGGGCVTNR